MPQMRGLPQRCSTVSAARQTMPAMRCRARATMPIYRPEPRPKCKAPGNLEESGCEVYKCRVYHLCAVPLPYGTTQDKLSISNSRDPVHLRIRLRTVRQILQCFARELQVPIAYPELPQDGHWLDLALRHMTGTVLNKRHESTHLHDGEPKNPDTFGMKVSRRASSSP